MAVTVITKKCPQNHACPAMYECPVGALKQDGFKAPTVVADLCIDCGKCARMCPRGALVMHG